MKTCFFDSSAVAKLYHAETGTAEVEALLRDPENECIVSQLTTVEICSVFALKVRTGAILARDLELLRGKFFADLKAGRFRVVVLEPSHLQMAQELILKYGLTHAVRSLDAIQLAVAIPLRSATGCNLIVAADSRLCAVAAAEGFEVLNPESNALGA